MALFQLRAEVAHDEDVRGVGPFPALPGAFLTASRDRTAKLWKPAVADGAQGYECACTFVGHSHGVFQALPCLDTVVTASQDHSLVVWDPHTGHPVLFLTGHTGPVSCCAVSPLDGRTVSGSWDTTAIVWAPTGQIQATLKGHSKNVLCVCWLSTDVILTGSGDRTIMQWTPAGVPKGTLTGHTDAVRAIKEAPGLGFISASNDCTLVLWALSGEKLQVMAEHTNLVYGVTVLSPTEYASGSEDKTLRIWRGGECVQTIPHPCMVWDVAALPDGDLVTGGSDGKARVWTRRPERASPVLAATMEASLAAQAVSTQVVGGVDVSKLPNEEALNVPGAKDGQILMIKRKNHPTAEVYMWGAFAGKWAKTGDLMESPDNAVTMGPQELNGVKYDYVFPVELNAGAGNFKLGYNRGENPYTAAQRFIWDNAEAGLGQHFLDEIAAFITQNVEQITGGDESMLHSEYAKEAARLKAEGQEVAMAPKEAYKQLEGKQVAFSSYMQEALQHEQEEKERAAGKPAAATPEGRPYPLDTFDTFPQPLNVAGVLKKVSDLSGEIIVAQPEAALGPEETGRLKGLLDALQAGEAPLGDHIGVLAKILRWPPGKRFPAVDVARALLLTPAGAAALATPPHATDCLFPLTSFLEGTATGPEQMLVSRALATAWASPPTRALLAPRVADILAAGRPQLRNTSEPARQAFATLLRNIAVHAAQAGDPSAVEGPLPPLLTEFVLYEAIPAVTLTLFAAIGTLCHPTSRVRDASVEGFKKSLLPDCLRGKTTFGDSGVILTAKALLADFFPDADA